ncbi:MAG: hypothetical protein WB679_14230, partial [Terracidiphilus sp.]
AKVDEQKLQQVSDARTTDYMRQIAGGQTTAETPVNVMKDNSLTPENKRDVVAAFDLPPGRTSNPAVIDQALAALAQPTGRPQPGDIIKNPGLSPRDAHWLAGLAQQPNTALAPLQSALAQGRQTIAQGGNAGSGLMNPAGLAAYGRFQQALIGQARNGELPSGKDLTAMIANFRPTSEDTLSAVPVPTSRLPLGQIFGMYQMTESDHQNAIAQHGRAVDDAMRELEEKNAAAAAALRAANTRAANRNPRTPTGELKLPEQSEEDMDAAERE